MNAAVITLGALAAFVLAYRTYGRFVARRIFRLRADRPTPSHILEDGVDYVPTRVPVLFGHHFASIAGLGPILGPAIAVIWGWVPAVLWVVFGSIFIGAIHDLGALTVSLRFQGRTIGDICRDLMGSRARMLALLIIFFLMSLAMGAFVSAISALFVYFRPDAVIPSLGLMVVAMAIGVSVYKLKVRLGPATAIGLAVFAGLILWGVEQPIVSYQWFASPETRAALDQGMPDRTGQAEVLGLEAPYGAEVATLYLADVVGDPAAAQDVSSAATTAQYWWIGALLSYAFVASVLPVWLLLQPRDYINSFQLYFVLATMMVGLLVAAMLGNPVSRIDGAAFRPDAPGAPPWLPMLFVTIACGAVSGFHSLVSSGTTVRQLNRESDALPIGYGAMLTEGVLAILVIMACVAGLGTAAWQSGGIYSSWSVLGAAGRAGLAAKLTAVVEGGANFLNELGIPLAYGRALLAVTIVSFALTTLDSATRLLRFNVEEICRSVKLDALANRYFASLVAVAGIAFFGLVPAGQALWILFGTTNQLLAGLGLLTISVFLYKLSRPVIYTVVPMLLMLAVSVSAMIFQLRNFWMKENWPLIIVSVIVLGMALWLTVEALLSFARGRGGVGLDEETPMVPAEQEQEVVGSAEF
jgi:carbon starvation protein